MNKTLLDADVAAVEAEGGELFIYDGREYVCQRTPIIDKLAMADAGFEAGFDFTIEVRTAQFPSGIRPPANTEIITLGGVDYCIVGTTPDQFGIVNHYAVKQDT